MKFFFADFHVFMQILFWFYSVFYSAQRNSHKFYSERNSERFQNSAFKLLKKNDYFVSSWEAHDNFYGISRNSVKNRLNIISISRSKISDFEKNFEKVYVINITLNKEELKNRLIKRGRESLEEIQKRLDRSYDKIEAKNLINFENDKPFEESKEAFI